MVVVDASTNTRNQQCCQIFRLHAPSDKHDHGAALPEMAMAVIDSMRGQGVGTALIDALAREAANHYSTLTLNVHLRNPAARLYTRAGFRVEGKGRGWFGVAMSRELSQLTSPSVRPRRR